MKITCCFHSGRPPDKSVKLKFILLISKPNIYCGCFKELSQLDCSFEYPKHMLKLMDKKNNSNCKVKKIRKIIAIVKLKNFPYLD